MSDIRDKLLYSRQPYEKDHFLKVSANRSFVDAFFDHIRTVVDNGGDKDWIVNVGLDFEKEGIGNVSGFAFGSERIKTSEVEGRSRHLAAALHRLGVNKDDVVQLYMPNNCDFHIFIFACWICGAVPSNTDPGLRSSVVKQQLSQTKAKVIVCSDQTLSKALEAAVDLDVEVVLTGTRLFKDKAPEGVTRAEDILASVDAQKDSPPKLAFDPESRSAILWSSGTTGEPKGIVHGWEPLLSVAKPNSPWPFSSIIAANSCFHASGLVTPIVPMGNSTLYLFHKDDVKDVTNLYHAAHRYQAATMLMGMNSYLELASTRPPPGLNLDSIQLIGPAGAGAEESVLMRLRDHFPKLKSCVNGYTMTEIIAIITISFTHSHLGPVSAGVVVKIRDPDTNEALGPHQVGEIMALPPYRMKGYLNRPEEDKAFVDEDGFCHTGDLGHYDEDGVLYYDGRLKELIKPAGCHLYPDEIENIIQKLPGVVEVGVFGRRDEKTDDLVTALVVKTKDSTLTADSIAKEVNANVDDFKRVTGGVFFVDKLPRNGVGKLVRKELLQMYKDLVGK